MIVTRVLQPEKHVNESDQITGVKIFSISPLFNHSFSIPCFMNPGKPEYTGPIHEF